MSLVGNRIRRAGSCFCLILAMIGGGQQRAVQPPAQRAANKLPKLTSRVIAISLSGLGADLTNGDDARLRIPTIRRLRKAGAVALGLESVFPSRTGPALASFVTGRLPADHGISADIPFDEKTGAPAASTGPPKGDPIWDHAAREGLTTAAIAFPLTAGVAGIRFNLPAPETAEQRQTPSGPGTAPVLPKDRPLAALLLRDAAATDAARALIEKQAPQIVLLHLRAFAAAQERFGLGSPESFATLEQLDAMIEQVIDATRRAGLHDDATFLLFSDAGAASVDREYRPNVALVKKGWLKPGASWEVVVQAYGGSAAVFVREPANEKFVREVEEFFVGIHNDPDSPIWRLFPRRDAARLGADPRPVLFLDAAPGVVLTDAASGGLFGKPTVRATAGASPSRAEMRGTLLLAGRGIKAGARLDYARTIDLAPTIAKLLGFEMKTARGRALTEALAP